MDKYNSISTPPPVRFDIIQLLRFLAALMVIIFHSIVYTSERLSPGFFQFGLGGFDGVSLFFVISGFVMIISSENLIAKSNGWRSFVTKRIIRIVPIYWIVITYKVVITFFASSLVTNSNLNIWYILKSYFFIPAKNSTGMFFPFYNVGWTLNFEMFFYILFTVSLALRIRPLIFFFIIFIPFAVLSGFRTDAWPDVSFYFNTIILNFLYGMIAAKLILMNIKLPPTLALITMLAGIIILFVPTTGQLADLMAKSGKLLYIPSFLVVYAGASVENIWGKKIPSWLIYLGAASYSLYLIHPIAAPLAPLLMKKMHLQYPWLSVLLGIAISMIAGTGFYRYCEKPLTEYISKAARKRKLV